MIIYSEKGKNPLSINLQLFADPEVETDNASLEVENELSTDGESSGSQEDATQPSSFEEAGDWYLKSLREDGVETEEDFSEGTSEEDNETAESEATEEVQEKGSTEKVSTEKEKKDVVEILKGLGVSKFDSPEKVAKSYIELESWATKLSQEKAENQKALQELRRQLDTVNSEKNQTKEQTEEEYDPQKDIDEFYANPKAYREKLLKEAVSLAKADLEQKITPVTEKLSAQERVAAHKTAAETFFKEAPDASEFMEKMAETLSTDNTFQSLSNVKDIVSHLNKTLTYVKGLNYKKPTSPEEAVAQLLENPEMFNKYIAGNEGIKKKLMSEAVKKASAKKVPPVITQTGSAQVVTKSPEKSSSFESLGEALKKSLFK